MQTVAALVIQRYVWGALLRQQLISKREQQKSAERSPWIKWFIGDQFYYFNPDTGCRTLRLPSDGVGSEREYTSDSDDFEEDFKGAQEADAQAAAESESEQSELTDDSEPEEFY